VLLAAFDDLLLFFSAAAAVAVVAAALVVMLALTRSDRCRRENDRLFSFVLDQTKFIRIVDRRRLLLLL